jgi:hypothetical protein
VCVPFFPSNVYDFFSSLTGRGLIFMDKNINFNKLQGRDEGNLKPTYSLKFVSKNKPLPVDLNRLKKESKIPMRRGRNV